MQKIKFVVQEFEPYEGWFDIQEFDKMNLAFDYINEKLADKHFFDIYYRVVMILFDSQFDIK